MRWLGLGCALLFAAGCGHVTRVRPTPVGAYEVEAAVGGPLANVGAVIPVPLSSVGLRYGIHPRGDIAAHLQLTPAVFGVPSGSVPAASGAA